MKDPITVKAELACSTDKAWTYYTDPKHIVNWNFASDDWCCPSAENDLRAGGKYTARMEAKDGSFGFDFGATYDEVIPGKKIIYTIGDGRKAQIDFNDKGKSCEVIVRFEAEGMNPREMQQQGWQAILNNYKKYAEQSN